MASFYGILGVGLFIGLVVGLGLVGLVDLIRGYFLARNLNRIPPMGGTESRG